MRRPHWYLALAIFGAGGTRALAAQPPSCTAGFNRPDPPERQLARRYAPIYFPMRSELYLPTLPFFAAFDSQDNDSSAIKDVSDPVEIAPPDRHAGRSPGIAWDSLNVWFLRRMPGTDEDTASNGMPPLAITYDVRALDAADERWLWTFLRNDEHAWKRTRWLQRGSGINVEWTLDSVQQEMQRYRQRFRVIRYYAFYLNDVGLEGHAGDLESVFVFVPDSVPGSRVRETNLRIVVGAGHTEYVPNGVLVLAGPPADYATSAADVAARPRVMIEFGDHSSAPDRYPYRSFLPGWDVNWHSTFVWGTRDVQASSGIGYLGSYDFGMTFPRDSAPWLFPSHLAGPAAVTKLLPGRLGVPVSDKGIPYSLVNARTLECLYEILESAGDDGAPALLPRLTTLFKILKSELDTTWHVDPYLALFDAAAAGDSISLVAFRRSARAMARWRGDVRTRDGRVVPPDKIHAWRHPSFHQRASAVFKSHLFRPTTNGTRTSGWFRTLAPHATFGLMTDERYRLGVGVTIPAIDFPLWLPGVLELSGGVYGTLFDGLSVHRRSAPERRWQPAVWVTYEAEYGSQLTWFLQLFKIWKREDIKDEGRRPSWQLEGGLSVGLSPNPKVRLRLGPRIDLARQLKADWAVQFSWVR